MSITSKAGKDRFSISINKSDFNTGELSVDSNVRPNKIFTADKSIIIREAGTVKEDFINKVIKTIIDFIQN